MFLQKGIVRTSSSWRKGVSIEHPVWPVTFAVGSIDKIEKNVVDDYMQTIIRYD